MMGYGQWKSSGNRVWCIAVLCVALCLVLPVGAQATSGNAAWSGAVGTASGQALAGATVELRGPGGVQTATTGVDGKFFFAHVEPGRYSVVVRPQGAGGDASSDDGFAGRFCSTDCYL